MKKLILWLLISTVVLSWGSALAKGNEKNDDKTPRCADCTYGDSEHHSHGQGCKTCEKCGGCLCDKRTQCSLIPFPYGKDRVKWVHCRQCTCPTEEPTQEPTPTVKPTPTTTVKPTQTPSITPDICVRPPKTGDDSIVDVIIVLGVLAIVLLLVARL